MSAVVDYPLCLRLVGRLVLLVGGGKVAEARAERLLEAGARLHVVAPQPSPRIRDWAAAGRLALEVRAYLPGDVRGHSLVFVATDDRAVSEAVAAEARTLGALVNAADEPDLCDFTLPSVGRRGLITVAVSTAGQAPALAARLRRQLEQVISPRDERRARLSAWLRRRLPRGPSRSTLLRAVAGPVGDAS